MPTTPFGPHSRTYAAHVSMVFGLACGCLVVGCGSAANPSESGSTRGESGGLETETGSTDGEHELLELSGLRAELHPEIDTLIVAHWQQSTATDASYVEFRFEDQGWQRSPARAREAGPVSEPLLGVPEGVEVEYRVVAERGRESDRTDSKRFTNGQPPSAMPKAEMEVYEADLASGHRWLLGIVSEKGLGGLGGPHWLFIVDREGRVVWYHRPIGGENGQLNQAFWPRIAPDGSHITIDRQIRFEASDMLFTTLDFGYQRTVLLEGHADCYDVAPDGSIFYTDWGRLYEMPGDGGPRRMLWRCTHRECYSNTVSYNEASDSIMLSFPVVNIVSQIDRASGQVLRHWGDAGEWSFEPSDMGFEWNHWAHLSDDGDLLVSTHVPGRMEHRLNRYEIDDADQTLRVRWSYGEGRSEYPEERGMFAEVTDSDNYIANYGPSGKIVELTPDKQIAWQLTFPERLLGNTILIDDLYALNRGPDPEDRD